VARLRTADREAAEELFNACYPRLAGWVRRLVDDDETAHEIAAEAFTRLMSRWSGLDNPQSYLYMIATNLVRDHWRKTSRERRAIRTMTAAVPREPAWQPAQDGDVRALIAFWVLAFLVTWGSGTLVAVSDQSDLVNGVHSTSAAVRLPFPAALALLLVAGSGPALPRSSCQVSRRVGAEYVRSSARCWRGERRSSGMPWRWSFHSP